MGFIRANGLKFAYDERGPASGPAVLLIMGLGTQMIFWPDVFCDRLVAAGFRVIRFDNRDCGLSSRVSAARNIRLSSLLLNAFMGRPLKVPYTLEDMAADAVGILDALSLRSAHVVGVSMGGMIAQLLAAHHPQRVRSLTSMMSSSGDPRLPRPRPRVNALMFGRRPKPTDREGLVRFGMKMYRIIGSPAYPTPAPLLRQMVEASISRAYDPAATMRQFAAIVANGSRVELLRGITVPTLVVHGADDPLMPLAAGRDTARQIPGAVLKVIPGMGHDFPLELMPGIAETIADHCLAADRDRRRTRQRAAATARR
jgi:proline iminopeptidase